MPDLGTLPKRAESRQKIVIIVTGGTMGSLKNAQGAKAPVEGVIENMMDYLKQRSLISPEIETEIQTVMIKDSTNMTPADQVRICSAVYETTKRKAVGENIIATVVVHGSDTAAEIMPVIGISVRSNMPVIGTGAMRSRDEQNTDAFRNMRHAMIAAESLAKAGKEGTYFVFNRKVMDCFGVREDDPRAPLSAFGSINGVVGTFEKDNLTLRNGNGTHQEPENSSPLMIPMSENVGFFKTTSGTSLLIQMDTLNAMVRGSKGIVIVGTHSLGIRDDLHDTLRCIASQIPTVVSAMTPGAEPGAYQVNRELVEIGIMPGIGFAPVDHAALRAAVGLGSNIGNMREMFENLRDRVRIGRVHEIVTAARLGEVLDMDYSTAVIRARHMNAGMEEAIRRIVRDSAAVHHVAKRRPKATA